MGTFSEPILLTTPHRALGHGVRDKEEIKLAVLHLRLFDKAIVDVSSLRRVLDELITLLRLALLEESLTDALVNDDQSDLGRSEGLNFHFLLLLF